MWNYLHIKEYGMYLLQPFALSYEMLFIHCGDMAKILLSDNSFNAF